MDEFKAKGRRRRSISVRERIDAAVQMDASVPGWSGRGRSGEIVAEEMQRAVLCEPSPMVMELLEADRTRRAFLPIRFVVLAERRKFQEAGDERHDRRRTERK